MRVQMIEARLAACIADESADRARGSLNVGVRVRTQASLDG